MRVVALAPVAAGGVALALAATGCVESLPPPAPPAPVVPSAFPAPEGDDDAARVVFGTDVPARVERVTVLGHVLVCAATPCSARLRYGEHRLRFTGLRDRERTSYATVDVRERRENVNHVLGRHHTSLGTTLGTFTTIVSFGAMLVPVVITTGAARNTFSPSPFVLGGMLGVGLSIPLFASDPSVHQDGATTHWR